MNPQGEPDDEFNIGRPLARRFHDLRHTAAAQIFTISMALRASREAAVAIGDGFAICMANVVYGFVRLAESQPDLMRVAGIVDETAAASSWRSHSLPGDVEIAETYGDGSGHPYDYCSFARLGRRWRLLL